MAYPAISKTDKSPAGWVFYVNCYESDVSDLGFSRWTIGPLIDIGQCTGCDTRVTDSLIEILPIQEGEYPKVHEHSY